MRAVGVLKALKTNGARCAVVFHDPDGYAGNRIIDYVRRTLQRRTMRRLSQLSDAAIFTLPLEKISWLPPGAPNVFYIPVGANLPAPEQAWKPLRNQTGEKPIVAIFSLSDQPIRALEVRTIAEAVTYAAKQVGPLQVRLMGRNSETGGEELRAQLSGTSVDVTSLGLLAAEDVVKALGSSDAMLFPRGSISTRRGSAIAGVACGLPVIAQDGSEVAAPVTQAGIALVPENSPKDFGPVLTRVLTDHAYRASLEERSRNAQATYFNWSVIAKQYVQALRMATDS